MSATTTEASSNAGRGGHQSRLPSPAVQLITGPWRDLDDLARRVDAALRGGIRWLQLRARERSARDLLDAARRLAPVLHEAGALFVVNDRIDIARMAGADGVHLPEHGLSPQQARRVLGGEAWLARSIHSIGAMEEPGLADLNAIQFGPVYDTASKRRFGPPQGLDELGRLAQAARRDTAVVAVGGITAQRMAECQRAGASAVSVIGAIWEATDIETAARSFTSS